MMRMAGRVALLATAMPIGGGSSGLPIGVQIMGPYLEDRTTVTFAQLAERKLGDYRAPPGIDQRTAI
jgi:amidase